MIIAHYRHRLPENYDPGPIRALTKERAPVWDVRRELYFKAFLLRERRHREQLLFALPLAPGGGLPRLAGERRLQDRHGSVRSRGDRNALCARCAQVPRTRSPLCLHGRSRHSARRGLEAAFAREIEHNREIAAQSDTVASAVGVDTRNWKVTRIMLSTNEANGNENTVAYQVLHLARRLLDTLLKGDDR